MRYRILVGILAAVLSNAACAETKLLTALFGLQHQAGDFVQVVRNGNGQTLDEARGTFVFGQDGAFRWQYTNGSEQIIVADGTTIWIVDPGLEQVIIKPQKDTIGRRPADVLVQPELLNELFDVDEVVMGDGFSAELHPKKGANAGYEWIKLTGQEQTVRRLEVEDALGNRTEILLENLHEEKTSMATFTPAIDDSFDIVDERSY